MMCHSCVLNCSHGCMLCGHSLYAQEISITFHVFYHAILTNTRYKFTSFCVYLSHYVSPSPNILPTYRKYTEILFHNLCCFPKFIMIFRFIFVFLPWPTSASNYLKKSRKFHFGSPLLRIFIICL